MKTARSNLTPFPPARDRRLVVQTARKGKSLREGEIRDAWFDSLLDDVFDSLIARGATQTHAEDLIEAFAKAVIVEAFRKDDEARREPGVKGAEA